MMANFNDIHIVGLDEERTTRSDPLQPFYDVHFVLSVAALRRRDGSRKST